MFYFKRAKMSLIFLEILHELYIIIQESITLHTLRFWAKAVTIAEANLDSFHSHSESLRNFEGFIIQLCLVLLPASNFWWFCRYNIKFYLDKQHCSTNLFHLLRGFYLLIRCFFFNFRLILEINAWSIDQKWSLKKVWENRT